MIRKPAKTASVNRQRVFALVILCVGVLGVLLVLLLCHDWLMQSEPLDLSGCTAIEVKFAPSALDYFAHRMAHIFIPGEKDYLESLETFTIRDTNQIEAFAHELALGIPKSGSRNRSFGGPFMSVTCYRNQKHLTSLKIYGRTVVTEEKDIFEYPVGRPNLEIIEPPETRRFKLRFACGRNISRLYKSIPPYSKKFRSYQDPKRWCDAFVQYWQNLYKIIGGVRMRYHDDLWISETLTCPGADEHILNEPNSPNNFGSLSLECHYARNPDCKADSPEDVVLFFETKAGWNQHGGPELFTFDHHDPKGGCVLLNDGTVKFIRTKEEIQQLRWK